MHTRFLSFIAFVLALGIIAACSVPVTPAAEASKPAPRTSATYALHQGEVVTLAPGTTLKLDRVNDSRCRKGQVCVWEGYISYKFTLEDRKGRKSFVLAEKMPNISRTATENGLTFTLEGLDPPEPAELNAAAPDYRVSLRVNITRPS
ncbi:hypothetical protein [Massilia endophytica]|uniref:hypothetical protein n=1 Tax=Massilia endophytica TaxID=2899220 RepID=UPI001E5D5276|nr:hypothetical protein [Massilia endophytica]UGQ47180.1 hypothetical protein LSQ66_01490 [Massilia endophytica]